MKDGVFSHTTVTEMVNQLCYMKDGVFRHTTVTGNIFHVEYTPECSGNITFKYAHFIVIFCTYLEGVFMSVICGIILLPDC